MRFLDPGARWTASVYGFGVSMLGATTFIYRAAVHGLEPIPAAFGGARMPLVFIAACVLVVGGAAIAVRWRSRAAAGAVGVVLSVWLLLHVVAIARNVHSGSEWVCAFETLSLWSAAWALAGHTWSDDEADDVASPTPVWLCVAALGVACIVFGISHFVYIGYVASVLPAWLPWHRFWGYGTGVAHVAAGIALVTRVQARLAATLLGTMFGAWVLMLHLPRVIHAPGAHSEWTSMCIALAMCGTAFVIATVLGPALSTVRAARPAVLLGVR